MTGSLAAIDAGLAYHARTLREGRFAPLFGTLIDLRRLEEADLARHPVLVVPCRTNGARLAPHRTALAAYMEAGGFLVVMGETHPHLFLEGVEVTPVPTNFWWWLEPGADLGVRIAAPGHPLLSGIPERDVTWHVHGTLAVAGEAETLVTWEDAAAGGPLMVAARRGAGRLLVTTLDPIYHHGSGFMPATTRFLEGFLPRLAGVARG